MTPLPPDLIPFRKKGEKWLKEGQVEALEFSGRTYQVSVHDPEVNESFWVFLHLTEQGELADSFCLCSDETENDRCAHMAAAFLKIYNGGPEPLHKRYEASFWRALGMVLAKKNRVAIKGKNSAGARFLKELFEKSVPPTEETSLKFSDLTESELEQVRKGHLTPRLHYEFSYWSDLAKSLLWTQEKNKFYKISFEEDKSALPTHFSLETDNLTLSLTLEEEELASLIPFLQTVESPLKVRGGFKDRIALATFDYDTGVLKLKPSDFSLKGLEGKRIGEWLYVSDEGFFRVESDPRLLAEEVKPEEMSSFLTRYHPKLASSLIHPGLYELKGSLKFNKKGDLTLSHYLFEPGDLDESTSWKFGDWVALKGKGFWRVLQSKYLPKSETIARDKVYEWVMTHQSFLNGVEGFRVHLKSLETTITWEITARGGLIFHSGLKGEFVASAKEFGQLIWVPGQGFFSKTSFQEALQIPSESEILPQNISYFLTRNEEELKLIAGFFLKKNPMEQGTLDLKVIQGKIVVTPHFELSSEFKECPIRFYDDFIYVEGHGFFHLTEKYFLPLEWRRKRALSEREWGSFFDKTLPALKPYLGQVDPLLKTPDKLVLKWGETLYFESALGRLPFEEFLKAYRSGKRFFLSEIGRFDLKEKRFEALGELFKKSRFPEVSLMEVYKLKAMEEMDLDLSRFTKDLPMDISLLKSSLRPYQEIGVKWLWRLYSNELSGLLCDDMGLGKTHQTMGLMAAIEKSKAEPGCYLVVCPTSVLYHWQEKLKAFLPAVEVTVFHGLKRSLTSYQKHKGVLLTSYGLLRNEIEALKEFRFDLAVFDEVQMAKNHLSLLWRRLREIKASMVLGLTGTPIENHLRELKSLFDLCLPPLLPPEAEFVRLFVKPIEREESLAAKALLHRTIEPFLLRRKKEEVLQDLPEKTEEISHTDLAPSQKKLYQEIFMQAKMHVLPELLDEKKIVPYIHIFALLSSLKKICDHPALYLKETENYKKYHSGKWELFLELLSEALGSEQKVVVFSHFLGMLDIIESHLKEAGIGFASLRGSTPNRQEMIKRFQTDPNCKVFVASLQAGGLGIDLTAASVVIHYDRWWNAARENQATDRVHRIGQKRGVQVFKLVTVGTLEERIHELIEKKQKRMEEIVGGDETQVIKNLTREELIELLRDQ